MNTSFYTPEELKEIGFKKIGENVLVSRKSSIYSPEKISLGNNVRIDDFCILSGYVDLGSNIHISAYCALYGRFGIIMEDFTGLSPRTTLFSAMDDFSGEYMISPMAPSEFTNVAGGNIHIKKYAHIGAGCIVFPSLDIGEGAVAGAMSLINKSLESWTIYAGIPAKEIKKRSEKMSRFQV